MNKNELKEILSEKPILIDVRSAIEFSEINVSCSVNIPLDQIYNQLEKNRNHQNVVVFCKSGICSAQAKIILEKHGILSTFNAKNWIIVNKSILNHV